MATEKEQTILAIETAVCGGSVALLHGSTVSSARNISSDGRASEIVLGSIDDLLRSSNIDIATIDHIAISAGPGSFTGIRIGYATALGLADSIGCGLSSHSLMDAFTLESRSGDGEIYSVVNTGRGHVAVQRFNVNVDQVEPAEGISIIAVEEVRTFVSQDCVAIICDQSIVNELSGISIPINSIEFPAASVGKFAAKMPSQKIEPILLSRT